MLQIIKKLFCSLILLQVKGCVGTKFIGRWADLAINIALDAVNTVTLEENGRVEIDIKRYAKVEKIPGGAMEESRILNGVMLNKDVTHPKMKRYIEVSGVKLVFFRGEVSSKVGFVFCLESKDCAFGLFAGIQERGIASKCGNLW